MSIIKRITKKTEAAPEAADVKAVDPSQTEVMEVVKTDKPAVKKVAKKKAVEAKTVPNKIVTKLTANTLLAPLVTEKTAHLADAGVYAFIVPIAANRVAVGQAFRELYKVTPVKVNILRVHGKEHKFGRNISRRSDWKKALVTVSKGTRIDIFEKI